MDLQLKGHKALVLGASRGLGRAIAQRLGEEGALCAIAGRHEDTIAKAAQELHAATGAVYHPVVADSCNPTLLAQAIGQAAERLGGLAILVNSAARPSGAFAEDFAHVDEGLILHDFEEKFLGTLRAARAAVSHMREAGWGRIVAIGGLTARSAGSISAGARNAALVNLIRTMSRELGRDQITANVVHPALTVTETMEERLHQMAQRTGFPMAAMIDAAARDNPQGRLISAAEVADVVTFLCSPRSSAVNGEAIAVGGGSGSGVFY